MDKIKELFDPKKDIYRAIEKVITYDASQEHRLTAEISEYVVTESIEEQFEKLLSRMQIAMEEGSENEVGVWVSGFYGSGKSSFTKYLGLALAERSTIGGIPFRQHLEDRLHKPQTKALLSTVAKRFPAAIVFLDLASEMLAGATMEDISTVLFYKVLQFAGFSRNLKVASFERKAQKDGRYEEFKEIIQNDIGVQWSEVQNDPLVVDSMIPEIAHRMYPELFKTPTSFSTETTDFIQFENERVMEMLDIIRDAGGKQHIVFIIDEVGQYIGTRQNLILNLDGLAKNLKQIGKGRVWIISTAQQTLTEDDPRTALNSPELYKLKDRFPIQIDLESNDIKEICYRRLLGKSPDGELFLSDIFEKNGQKLRHNTKLQDAKYYDFDFNKETFINLYPFLPAHFDILLYLLGALAKSTGGIGLRSAIKVIQDILIEGTNKKTPIAEHPVGWLATTVTLYDTLAKDIQRAFPSIHRSIDKALIRFPDSKIHQGVAKTVALLQIMGNLPVTIQNVSSLMQPEITAPSLQDDVKKAVNEMIGDRLVPFGEQDGNLCFFSEKLNDIEQERAQFPIRAIETQRIFNESLKDAFPPLPSIRFDGSLSVTSGIKSRIGTSASGLSGDRETIQTIVELVKPVDYETARTRTIDESRQQGSQYMIFLLGRSVPEIEKKIIEIFRCREICKRYRNEPDQEIKEYCTAQIDRAAKISLELKNFFKQCLSKGIFVFRGQTTAVDNLGDDILEACKKNLSDVASQVFDRYSEAPVRAGTSLAEKFLRTNNLTAMTSKVDPLGIVQLGEGTPSIQSDHKSLSSIRGYIERNGTADGKRLIEHFASAPFGWSKDTLRYLVAALLLAGEIKLKVSGREVTVNGQQAIDALKTNNAFKDVGVSLREGRPSIEVLARAAERLTELVGDMVMPLEDDISKTAAKNFPRFQARYAPLGEKLDTLEIPGKDRIDSLQKNIADLLFTDASDAPELLGSEESILYENLRWAGEVDVAFKQGLENTIKSLQSHKKDIESLPSSGIPGDLKNELADEFKNLSERLAKEDFYKHASDLNTVLTKIQKHANEAASKMKEAQKTSIEDAKKELYRLPEWAELNRREQVGVLDQLEGLRLEAQEKLQGLKNLMEGLRLEAQENLQGLKNLISQEFNIHSKVKDQRSRIIDTGEKRKRKKEDERQKKASQEGSYLKTLSIPERIDSLQSLNDLLEILKQVRVDALKHEKMEIFFKLDTRS
ncbi:BREX system P-loop protein BrxC [Desulfobacterales bacterium HSG16]|nr:BREX system P-loop protein BrxC [Desulfobacterales bacterium HSG16]